ncbi:thiamine pyrophosphate-binding protein [Segatella copri]|uniref:thiamine pyrophosphate-binding protein n=1 Tax=Segatella copri TaxID=165179 RepID=UPI003D01640A
MEINNTQMIKVSDFIINFFEKQGVKHMFMLPGGMAMHIDDSIGYAKNIKPVFMLHEQACTFAAESYARVTNNLGVVCTTCGPAATNTLTGVACSWIESTPLLVLTGQVKRADLAQDPNLRQLGVQEVNIVDMAKPITKYAKLITEPENIQYELEKAVYLCKEGRPGPVLLDIPVDVQACRVDETTLKHFVQKDKGRYSISDALIDEVVSQIEKAKRPVFYVGAGVNVANASEDFRKLAEKLNIPVLVHWNGMNLLENEHPLFMGHPGAVGQRAANFVLQNADLLITIGTRLALLQTGFNFAGYAKNAFHVMVDIDKAELDKTTLHPNLKIQGDAGEFIRKLLASDIQVGDYSKWIMKGKEWNTKYPSLNPEWLKDSKYINSFYFVDELSRQMNANDIYCGGRAGTCVDAVIQAFNVKKGQGVYVTKGLSSMGNGLPAAIGAAYATKKKVVCVNGDGGFAMNIQELEVIRRDNLPVKMFILDNQGYSTVRNTQTNVFDGHFVGCNENSGLTIGNIKGVAEAYGIKTFVLKHAENISATISDVLSYDGPALCVVWVDPAQPIVPRQANYKTPEGQMASRPLEDMRPLLEREELEEIMSVSKEQ